MTATSFSILITDDSILEGNETFYLTIDPSSLHDDTNVDVGSLFQVTVIIVEDDCKWLQLNTVQILNAYLQLCENL